MKWPKLSTLCDKGTHLWVAWRTSLGPSNDAPEFAPLVREGAQAIRWYRILADKAYDSEAHHTLCRVELKIPRTLIPVQSRGTRRWPQTTYRRQMKRRFHRHAYHQRWQAESAFSRHKRRLGSALRAHSAPGRNAELALRVLTHNLMLLTEAA
jgi:transposase